MMRVKQYCRQPFYGMPCATAQVRVGADCVAAPSGSDPR